MANKSTRKLTKQQFQEGTTIDGDRLQDAMNDVADRMNDIPLQDLKKRYVQTQYVGGFSPNKAVSAAAECRGFLRTTPFTPSFNKANTGSDWTNAIENPYRYKGYDVAPLIDETAFLISMATPDLGKDQGTYWTMEIPMEFQKPVIITDITFYLLINEFYSPKGTGPATGGYDDYFQWLNDVLTEINAGTWTDDIQVQMLVENPLKPEDREVADVEIHKYGFDTWSVLTTPPSYWEDIKGPPSGITGGNNDMKPTAPSPTGLEGGCDGLMGMCIDIKDKDIPIPAKGRVRLSLMIPQYQCTINASPGSEDLTDTAPYGRISCNSFHYSWCVTLLEELEDK